MTEYSYLKIMQELLLDGNYREGRNGGVYSLFGRQIRFDLSQGFPLLTTKFVPFKAVVTELLWMLKGKTNVAYLHKHGVTIWDEWVGDDGELGPIYGYQWRSWSDFLYQVDQISNVIQSIKEDPYGRRHVVSAWNPGQIEDMALPPCHCLFQFYVSDGKLSCQLYQRSADIFLGVPFNIASYALLTHIIARECGLQVGEFIHTFGDVHLYANHRRQAKEQLERTPRAMPEIWIEPDAPAWEDLEPEHVFLCRYDPYGKISAPVSK